MTKEKYRNGSEMMEGGKMNRQKALLLLISVAVVLYGGIMACATGDDAGYAEKCAQDCSALGYEYCKLIRVSELGVQCRCWNEGMTTRHNPWGEQ